MICPNCKTQNVEGAQFCRSCGQALSIKENPMDKWPNLDFRPVSIVSLKKYKSGRIFFFKLFRLVCFLFGLWSLYWIANRFGYFVYYSEGYAYDCLFDNRVRGSDFNFFTVITIFAFVVSFLITISLYRKCPHKCHEKTLKEEADYIQGSSFSSRTYLFFIKDNFWGCYNMRNFSIQIPAAYDFLEWREYGRLLNGKKGNKSIIIDINGQPLK